MDNGSKNLVIENASIFFKNFSGKEGKFNAAGVRSFCVEIDPSIVDQLIADGWNVKTRRPRNDDDEPTYYISVAVTYEHYPPSIYLVSGGSETLLDESCVGMLDWSEIQNVDLVIRPRIWDDNGKQRIKAYAKIMHVTIEQDPFSEKYSMYNKPAVKDDDLPF